MRILFISWIIIGANATRLTRRIRYNANFTLRLTIDNNGILIGAAIADIIDRCIGHKRYGQWYARIIVIQTICNGAIIATMIIDVVIAVVRENARIPIAGMRYNTAIRLAINKDIWHRFGAFIHIFWIL